MRLPSPRLGEPTLIPDYQTVMLPLLNLIGDQQEHALRQAADKLAKQFGLTDSERRELLPSGRQATFLNRVSWARTYMSKAGLLESPRRGIFRITTSGMKVIANPPPQINIAFLEQFPGYIEFRGNRQSPRKPNQAPAPATPETPEEVLEDAYQNVRERLSDELLTTVKTVSPQFFEQLVVDLLVSMGYGGTREGAGRAVGGTGDGGIDGVINEDLLGLDSVYIQAKRWEAAVGRPEVQKFAGALQGHRSKKGVLITTSSFTHGAEEYVDTIENKIVLINGATLTQLLMDHNVGVSPVSSYDIKKIDSYYFLES